MRKYLFCLVLGALCFSEMAMAQEVAPSIKIKGLYIGMDAKEAQSILEQRLGIEKGDVPPCVELGK